MSVIQTMEVVNKSVLTRCLPLAVPVLLVIDSTTRNFVQVILDLMISICLLSCYDEDIDECSEGTSGCSQLCTNTIGSYTCTCDNGYQLTNDNHTCTDIDECTLNNNGGCEQTCHNTDGSYYCSCFNGFSLNDQNCTGIIIFFNFCYYVLSSLDINECNTNNGGCGQDCINTVGSYQCQCREGFQFTSNGRSCTGNFKIYIVMCIC